MLPDEIIFPKPELAEPDGLLAIGGDLSPLRLLTAYYNGIFPWYNAGEPILWWSLEPRLLLFSSKAKFSKSLLQRIKHDEFEICIDTCFHEVMQQCAFVQRQGQDGTWITSEIIEAYTHLHDLGFAHSFETFQNGKLVGGLYGVSIGNMFTGESMFHLVSDASKVAFYYLVDFANIHNFDFIDCQQETSHLKSLGAETISRKKFLRLLSESVRRPSLQGKWSNAI